MYPGDKLEPELSKESTETEVSGPLQKTEIEQLLKSPLKKELQDRLYGGSEKTFYFFGDSLVRNQYEAFCLLLKKAESTHSTQQETDQYWGRHVTNQWGFQSCTDSDAKISAHFAFVGAPNTTVLDFMLNRAPKPSVIYWDGGMWSIDKAFEQFYTEERFPQLIKEVAAGHKDAKSIYFGAHKPCKTGSYETHFYPGITERIQSLNAQAKSILQQEHVGYVDGYAITDDKCALSDKQGIHYNTLTFDELSAFFDVVQNL